MCLITLSRSYPDERMGESHVAGTSGRYPSRYWRVDIERDERTDAPCPGISTPETTDPSSVARCACLCPWSRMAILIASLSQNMLIYPARHPELTTASSSTFFSPEALVGECLFSIITADPEA